MKNRFRATVGVTAGIWLSFSFGSAAYAQARSADSAAVKKEAIVGVRDQGSMIKINFKEDSPMGTKDSSSKDDEKIVSALDTEYQEAVKNHDAATMNRILADDFVLVTGKGKVFTKSDLLKEAADTEVIYERQEDSNQTVRVWGNVAIVTALLWAKGTQKGVPFDYKLWFSDMYVRTQAGWRYLFAQASIPLPKTP